MMTSSIYSIKPSSINIPLEDFSKLEQKLAQAIEALDFKAAARFIREGANPNQLVSMTPEINSIITAEMCSEKIWFAFTPCSDCDYHEHEELETTLSEAKLPAYLIGLIYKQDDFITACTNYEVDLELQILETYPNFLETLFASSLLNQDFERTKLFMELGFTLSTPLVEGFLGTAFFSGSWF